MMKTILALLALWPAIVFAQTPPKGLASAPELSFKDWKTMTAGKTVVYEVDGQTFGYEHYTPESNAVTFREINGMCSAGTWFMQADAFCFDWQSGPLNCFHHKKLDGQIYIIGLDSTGAETTDIQKVARIDTLPLTCGPALLSAYHPAHRP